MSDIDNEVGAALQRFNESQTKKAQEIEQAIRDEDAWIVAFNERRDKVIRPTMDALGEKLRAKEHDYNLVETPFRRDNRAVPDEASIRMDIYLSTDRTRTGIGMDRRPGILFKTHHRSKLVHLVVSDMTDRGGTVTKEGEYPLDRVTDVFIKEKFIELFHRLMKKV
jgi:hypothetical protein